MDVSQYLEIFLDETNEHLQNLNTQILSLEQEPDNMDTINEIFRAAHSLKGMAGTMGYKRMQNLTHDMENVFSEVRNGNITVKANMIDILFQCLDALEEYNTNIRESADEGTNDNEPLIKQLNEILNGGSSAAADTKQPEAKADEANAKAADATEADADAKWQQLKLGESETVVLMEALTRGSKVYGMTVKVQETCILKAARAFLVFKAVEENGEIIFSDPATQDIEDEKFDLDFSLIVVSDSPLEKLLEDARSVSEIEDVTGGVYNFDKAPALNEDSDEAVKEKPAEAAEEAKTAKAEPVKAEPAKAGAETTAPAKTETQPDKAPAAAKAEQNSNKNDKKQAPGKPVVNRTVRVDIEKLDTLMNLVSELIIAKNSLVSASTSSEGSTNTEVNDQIEYLESVTTSLHESVMKVRMVPIESVVTKFPRMIRDLSKKLDKKMELYMTGEETELDRTVVDEIGDPLMHLLRNSADHGLESAELRKERGKPEVGSIFLDAYQDGNNVVIEVRDDGNGIDTAAVRDKAIDRGVITPEQAENMTEKEIIDLLFNAGFSTAKTVSDVSGRGVGLDVVKSKIESLSGEVEVKSKLGEGSTWTIRLPLTLAIIQALMVIVGDEKYAISLDSIQTIEDIEPGDVKLVQNNEVIHLRGVVIPLIRLSDVLDIASSKDPKDNLTVVIVKKGDKLAGLVVDELIGQQEIVIKSMGKYISKCKIISGATILGDGEVALILDANALI
ncbi:MAG: chemotaxis protein CheA [Lachnospiraceae bacterium]|nr:chemotaxis protein CheA [Lachnospiraceae bacterium]